MGEHGKNVKKIKIFRDIYFVIVDIALMNLEVKNNFSWLLTCRIATLCKGLINTGFSLGDVKTT